MTQKKILVVSGDHALLDLLQKNLTESGFNVVSMEEESQEMDKELKSGQPDLVIVDIKMPKMEGIKVSLSIRKKYDVPIIMLAASPEEDKVKGLDLHNEDHLSDSMDVVHLMDWIKETFSRNSTMNYIIPDLNGYENRKN